MCHVTFNLCTGQQDAAYSNQKDLPKESTLPSLAKKQWPLTSNITPNKRQLSKDVVQVFLWQFEGT